MTKHITVKLTEDQHLYIRALVEDDMLGKAGQIVPDEQWVAKEKHVAFDQRIITKFDKALAQAKTK